MLRSLALALASLLTPLSALELQLPTENHHLFTGEPEKFYMYVDRIFEGETSKPWEGGAYGYVRTPLRIGKDVVLTKFHEGIDIKPDKRDKAGNPLDLIMAVSDGIVVHASDVAGRSNYGKYIVVEHNYGGDAFYSLYAHLAKVTVKAGDPVKMGSVLGQMGYTGDGFYGSNVRAHLHLEMCLKMSDHFDGWHKAFSGGLNHHGNYSGLNLAGMDVATLYLEHKKNPALRIQDFVLNSPAYFKLTIPRDGEWDFARRHRWMVKGDIMEASPSWELSFTATGLITGIAPSQRPVSEPVVTAVRDSRVNHRHLTRGLIDGQGDKAVLTRSGKQLLALLTDDFPIPTPATSVTPASSAAPAGE
ncbi:M23 family metallopeptidase [Luteolibacter flavescens]|uniref:M23 family metallopeptidase n=1 Tax=Luteolibacter flavescens TaxID=1859460 RepID=A0ABT3FTR9_9BACT|nr:M23 family metallopeptidase [Luteolibacter flavescens]MCW1886641.1 M23 family metallopeptidase [Luteolibacter flavescens]